MFFLIKNATFCVFLLGFIRFLEQWCAMNHVNHVLHLAEMEYSATPVPARLATWLG